MRDPDPDALAAQGAELQRRLAADPAYIDLPPRDGSPWEMRHVRRALPTRWRTLAEPIWTCAQAQGVEIRRVKVKWGRLTVDWRWADGRAGTDEEWRAVERAFGELADTADRLDHSEWSP